MKTGKAWITSISVVLTLFLAGGSPEAAVPKKVLQVGVVLRLNDKFNDSVDALKTGIETAKALFEKKNKNVQVQLKYYPHSESLESVLKAADQVISDQVPAVVGAEMSDEAIVLGDRFKDKEVAFITPTASNPSVTEGKSNTFRACFSDTQVADRLASYLIDQLKPSSVGVIHNISYPYTHFLSTRFQSTFGELMKKHGEGSPIPLLVRKVLGDQKTFESEIDEFMKRKVSHVVMLNYQTPFTQFALQAAQKGYFPVYLGSDGWGSNENLYRKLVTESSTGDRFMGYRNSYWKEDSKSTMAAEFRQAHEAKFRGKPDAWNAISFDATWILLTAMNRAYNPRDSKQIVDKMKGLKNVSLVTTRQFSFGPDNSPSKDLYIYTIGKSGIRYEATLR